MSAIQNDADGRRTAAELRRMDDETARSTLTVDEYERREQIIELHDEADEQRREWEQAAADATETLVFSDASDLAADVSVFGNDLAVYYALDDPRLRDILTDLAETVGIDPEADPEDIEDIHADEVDDEDVTAVAGLLADLVCLAAEEWNGRAWRDLSVAERDAIRRTIAADPPEGWGLAGLMDAWSEIEAAVEQARDERLERVRKFRTETRRGDR